MSQARGRLGTADNQLNYRISNIATAREALAASRSRIEDTDYAIETAALTRGKILQNSQLALQAKGQRLAGDALLKLITG